jgi:hypothetical protein
MACAAHASDNPNKAMAIVLTIVSSRYSEKPCLETVLEAASSMGALR